MRFELNQPVIEPRLEDILSEEQLYHDVPLIYSIIDLGGRSSEMTYYISKNLDFSDIRDEKNRIICLLGGKMHIRSRPCNLPWFMEPLDKNGFDKDYLDMVIRSLDHYLTVGSEFNLLAPNKVSDSYLKYVYPPDSTPEYILCGETVSMHGREYLKIPVTDDMKFRPLKKGTHNALRELYRYGQIGLDKDEKFLYIRKDQNYIRNLENKKSGNIEKEKLMV